MERLTGNSLETDQIDPMTAIQPNITLREVVPNYLNHSDTAEEAGSKGSIARRATQKPGVFGLRGFYGNQSCRTNDKHTHIRYRARKARECAAPGQGGPCWAESPAFQEGSHER